MSLTLFIPKIKLVHCLFPFLFLEYSWVFFIFFLFSFFLFFFFFSIVKYPLPPLIRLVGGSGSHEGRLEVFFQEEWGTVCFGKEWDYKNLPHTVCKQIGLHDGAASLSRKYGDGEGRIWLQNISCDGSEPGIDSCNHTRWGKRATCDHSMDIGIKCDSMLSF